MKTPSAGFTLVEVIASLLIVGILGAIAGMGIITGMRENTCRPKKMPTWFRKHRSQWTALAVN